MSRALISRSPDLQRLVDAGYEVDVVANHLLLRSVPYVNERREVKLGTLVSTLAMAGDVAKYSGDHVAHFAGEQPCDKNGSPINGISHKVRSKALADDLLVDRSFSSKPASGYTNYFDKMSTYAQILSGPAAAIDPSATPKTFAPVEMSSSESVFKYMDTASSRAGIAAIAAKVANDRVGIIGVGGTGAYVLDFISKTPVEAIHLFDGDRFVNHNAFRAPGAAAIDVLRASPNKAQYFCDVYSGMRRGIVAYDCRVTETNVEVLDNLSFVFVCIDEPSAKAVIFERLHKRGIPCIDVGLGIEADAGELNGTVRVTTVTNEKRDHIATRISRADGPDDDYRSNIQIAELNALNAALAVIKWKKIRGVYADQEREHNTLYTISFNSIASDEQSQCA